MIENDKVKIICITNYLSYEVGILDKISNKLVCMILFDHSGFLSEKLGYFINRFNLNPLDIQPLNDLGQWVDEDFKSKEEIELPRYCHFTHYTIRQKWFVLEEFNDYRLLFNTGRMKVIK